MCCGGLGFAVGEAVLCCVGAGPNGDGLTGGADAFGLVPGGCRLGELGWDRGCGAADDGPTGVEGVAAGIPRAGLVGGPEVAGEEGVDVGVGEGFGEGRVGAAVDGVVGGVAGGVARVAVEGWGLLVVG